MATVRVERLIEADPTSVALLLAGPPEFWPDAGVAVRARPPRRTPTAYVTTFEFSGDGVPTTTGVLTLTYEPRGRGECATSALLRLDWSTRAGEGRWVNRVVAARALGDLAEGFLANLAAAAEERSRAA
jgi:hypothetical protein